MQPNMNYILIAFVFLAGPLISDVNGQCCIEGVCNDIIYVDKLATGTESGADWDNAFTTLQGAIMAASADEEIWVAGGTYVPGGAANNSFLLPLRVRIIGGFFATPGSEGDCRERDADPATNGTILSGQGGLNEIVVLNSGNSEFTMLVGFKITEAGDVAIQNVMNSRARYQDLLIADNGSVNTLLAGGMNNLASSIIDVENCSFLRNTSPARGGAVQNEESQATFTNCRFNDNSAVMNGGGIYSFEDSIVTIEGCQFLLNEAGQRGGGVYSQKSNVTVVDCLFQPGAMPTQPLRACGFIRRKQRRFHTIASPTRRSACFVRDNLKLEY